MKKSKINYVYLVSDGDVVSPVSKKPYGTKIHLKKGTWNFLKIKGKIGNAISSDSITNWKGTVGVYNISEPEQVVSLANDMREHSLALAKKKILLELDVIFGYQAVSECKSFELVFKLWEQKRHQWTVEGEYLHLTTAGVAKVIGQCGGSK